MQYLLYHISVHLSIPLSVHQFISYFLIHSKISCRYQCLISALFFSQFPHFLHDKQCPKIKYLGSNKFINKYLFLNACYVLYSSDINKWTSRPEQHGLQNFPALQWSQWPVLQSKEDDELSFCTIFCSFTIGCRKCSPQLQTLKPNESNIMSLTCHWIKRRKNAVGSTPLPLLKSCPGFLLFCYYRHFNRLLDIVFLCAFPIFLGFTGKTYF